MEGGSAVEHFAGQTISESASYEVDLRISSPPDAAPRGNPTFFGQGSESTVRGGDQAASFYERRGKRIFDVVFSLIVLLFAGSWLFPLLAIMISIDSPGPVLFRQRRVGLNGAIFTCLKFRSMVHWPEAGFVQCRPNDARIGRLGRILRRTNLDELPQFINVLRGEMSVVGPRPHVPELDAKFEALVPMYRFRTAIKPGVTGLAQISGCRGEIRNLREMNNRVRFDAFYARNISFFIDIRLIVATILRTLQGDKRAY